ncbi:hypothetical protein D3C85_1459720 [compost metagenome]
MLRRIAVGDKTTIEISGTAGNIGDGLGDSPPGARFCTGDPLAISLQFFPYCNAEFTQLLFTHNLSLANQVYAPDSSIYQAYLTRR